MRATGSGLTVGARLPGGRRTAAILGLVAVAAAVLVAVVVSGGSSGGPDGGGAGAVGSTAPGAATVQWRNLVSTDTETGTLAYADPQTVYNRLSGTITWLPRVGQVIDPGQRLFSIDNRPVLLLDGRTPAFRELSASDLSGPDVYELNANLVRLGYDPDGVVVDDEWQPATTAGVEALQEHLGETETGSLSLGQVVFLPGPQMISAQEGAVGSTGGGEGSAVSDTDPRDGDTEFVDLDRAATTAARATSATTTTSTAATTPTTSTTPGTPGTPGTGSSGLTSRQLAALLQLLERETAELNRELQAGHQPSGGSPSSGSSPDDSGKSPDAGGDSGSPGGDGASAGATAILETTSTRLVVTVDLNPSLQYEARVGAHVRIELPDGGTVGARVTAVSAVASSSGSTGDDDGGNGSSGSPTVPVTITLDRPAKGGGLDQAAVSVIFAQKQARHVLSVPVTALVATSGASFAVQDAAPPHRLIPVTTGLYAGGYVEVSGSGVHAGLQVTDSQG